MIHDNRNELKFEEVEEGYSFKNELEGYYLTVREKNGIKMEEYDEI